MTLALPHAPRRFVASSARGLSHKEVRQLVGRYRGKRLAAVAQDWAPQPGMVYTQVRAISARVNQNYDAWPSEELKASYRSFIGKPIFVNHGNEDPDRARGVVVASRYVENGRDKYIEVIQETDGQVYPKLGHEIRTGGMDSVSMGVEAGFTICSVCENRATDTFDMCGHVKFHKGEYMRNQHTGERTLVYEKCHKLGFFELSYVFDPADETAVVSRVIAAGRHYADDTIVPMPSSGVGGGFSAPGDNVGMPARDLGLTQTNVVHDNLMPWDGPPKTAAWYRDASLPDWSDGAHASQRDMGDGHQLHVRHPWGEDTGTGTHSGNPHHEWRHTLDGGTVNGGIAPNLEDAQSAAQNSHRDTVNWDPDQAQEAMDPRLLGAGRRKMTAFQEYWLRQAFGEVEVPEDVDTLRDEDSDENDADDTFHNWITSPAELQDPDTDRSKQLDRHQEDQGLDGDRRVEDMEDFSAPSVDEPDDHYEDEDPDQPAMPINSPGTKKGRRTRNRGASMARYYAADDEGQYPPDDGSGGGYPDDQDDGGDPSQEDPDALVSEAEQDLADYDEQSAEGDDGSYEEDSGDGGDDSGYDDGADDSGGDEDDGQDSDYGPPPGGDEGGDESGGDQPPWLQENREGRRRATRPVKKRSGRGNRRAAAQGGEMARQSLATRQRTARQNGNQPRRHFQADDNGFTDGGPYGVDDSQGAQEDIFISQVPGSEAVETADGEPISNTENNLVARRNANQGQFDPNHYQRLADVIVAMPPAERKAMALKMATQFKADNPRFNELTFYRAAHVKLVRQGNRIFFAEDLTDPDKVDPSLPDTGASDLKGSDFESLALDDVETQPKDASIHAFKVFDSWLAKTTGRTARQHGNGNFIRNAAVSFAKQYNNPQAALQSLFPTLEYVLVQARRSEGKVANMRRYADESLDVAAPGGRIDVEAPVKNVTDELAQSSQFDLGDFANNAGDDLADPVLDAVDGNAGTWAPDKAKESSLRLASGVEAMRCAEAHIAAMPNTYNTEDRWKLTAHFETLRQAVVRDRTRLCEQIIKDQKSARHTARKVAAGASRGTNGLPQGLGRRTAAAGQRREASASSPDTDSLMFFN